MSKKTTDDRILYITEKSSEFAKIILSSSDKYKNTAEKEVVRVAKELGIVEYL